jgi:hypothetical protein
MAIHTKVHPSIILCFRSVGGKIFYSFSGIPYAKPPVGDLRLKRPLAAEPWRGTLDGSKWIECWQVTNRVGYDILMFMVKGKRK